MLSRRQTLISGSAAALALGATSLSAQDKRALSIVTGGTGGVYYPLGGGLAALLSKHVPGWQATAEVTGGSVDNLKLIGARRADIGFTMVDAAHDAAKGEDKFKGAAVPNRALAVLYPNRMHVVSVEGAGVNSFADLKGKRVSVGSPGGQTEILALRMIELAGLDKDKDIKRERLGAAESANAMKDRKIDAFFWVGGLPTAAVTDLAATPGVKIKLIDHTDLVDKLNNKFGKMFASGVIPAGTYPGQQADNKCIDIWNILVVHEQMTDDIAYRITKVVFEHTAEWGTVHGEAKNVKLENQRQVYSSVPFHPGALKYFAERGVRVSS
jgi:TRAP transporter TAXI family solute receptor